MALFVTCFGFGPAGGEVEEEGQTGEKISPSSMCAVVVYTCTPELAANTQVSPAG